MLSPVRVSRACAATEVESGSGMELDRPADETASGDPGRHGEWAGLTPEERFRVFAVLDVAGRVRYVGPTMAAYLGLEPESLFGRSVFDVIHPDDRRRVWSSIVDVVAAHGSTAPIELRVRRHDGAWRRIEVVAFNLVDGSDASAIVVMTHDVAERVLTDEAPDATGTRYRLLVEQSPDAIAVIREGQIIYTNGAGIALLGGTEPRDVLGRHFLGLVHPDSREIVAEAMTGVFADDATRALADVRLVRVDGTVIHTEGAIVPTPHEAARALHLGLRDITERHRSEADLAHRAFHDPLTGLANRELLIDRVGHACARARRTGSLVGMLLTDVDQFKAVNDQYGNQAGDAVLQAIAHRLLGVLRPSDTVARYGGDEFVVVCEDVREPATMPRIAERVERRLSETFRIKDEDVRITVSVGAVAEENPAGHELIEHADQAMYTVKNRRDQRPTPT